MDEASVTHENDDSTWHEAGLFLQAPGVHLSDGQPRLLYKQTHQFNNFINNCWKYFSLLSKAQVIIIIIIFN